MNIEKNLPEYMERSTWILICQIKFIKPRSLPKMTKAIFHIMESTAVYCSQLQASSKDGMDESS